MDIIAICILYYTVCIYIAYKLNGWEAEINLSNCLIVIVLSTAFNFLIKIPFFHDIKMILSTTGLCFIFKIYFKKDIFEILKTVFFIILIMLVSEMMVAAVCVNVLNIDFSKLYNGIIMNVILNVIVDIISVLVACLKEKIIKCYSIKNHDNLFNIFFMISIINILILSYFMLYKNLSTIVFYITFTISILYAIVVFIFIQKDFTINKKEEEYEKLKLYTNIIEDLVNDTAKFKHDFNNIMFMIKGYLDDDNLVGLKEHFGDKKLQEGKFSDILKLKKIKNAGLKGLLTYKVTTIESNKVKVYIEVLNDIDKIHIDIVDLCRILGILIDNAYEAAKNSKDRFISITFMQDETLNITILNSCNDNINVPNIYKLGYSTKGANRGIGLHNVRDIIDEKYDNVLLQTNFNEDVFIQELYIK
ncbi:sensor histidine kinase [Clostridium lundense]|uniref:sensor histidine kinase n=1 Tax=Clostridium lundense TaxID=319475 RepID=UPI000686C16C|nr:GHKL domain-containing protein [Clostridium lundense]